MTYQGRDEIRGWRENNSQFEYTTTVTSSDHAADGTYRVTTHIEGNFPGGTAGPGAHVGREGIPHSSRTMA